jgi:hypothetical protein
MTLDALPLAPRADVAALPAGGLLLTEPGRLVTAEASGVSHPLAGTGVPGFSGDGGAARDAQIDPEAVAVAPGGAILLADCNHHRIRRIAPDGRIETIVDTTAIDGSPPTPPMGARNAGYDCPIDVASLDDGTIVIADGNRVLAAAPGQAPHSVAGTGELPDEFAVAGEGGPATRVALEPWALAPAADGAVLIADRWGARIRRLARDGTIATVAGTGYEGARDDDGLPATHASVSPYALAAAPDGFVIADEGAASLPGEQPRVRHVGADGRIHTLAGTGRYLLHPPTGDEHRGDGGPAVAADLHAVRDLDVLADGGVVFVEETAEGPLDEPVASVLRYVAPAHPGWLAAALRRDTHRLFDAGTAPAVVVRLSVAAHVTLTLAPGTQVDADLPAGETTVQLPSLPARESEVVLRAIDGQGRVTGDRMAIYPRGWLPVQLASRLTEGVFTAATGIDGYEPPAVSDCRRITGARVDCRVAEAGDGCDRVVTVRMMAGPRLAWGTYRCPRRRHPRYLRRPQAVRRGDVVCIAGTDCRSRMVGRLSDSDIVPWG